MAYASLNHAAITIDTSKDSIVIVDNFQSVRGGATLDVTGFTPSEIAPGHIVIQETATGELKPMPVSGSAFAALPTGHTYFGIVINRIQTAVPFAGIMVRGTVNPNAMPYTVSSILTALKTALSPAIDFRGDR